MLISISFDSYNKYRFYRPWISRVDDWQSGQSPKVSWGKYQGDENGGVIEIMATPGDVIRWGQKGPSSKKTRSYWGIVQEDGSVEECSMTQAHKAWRLKELKPAEAFTTSPSLSDQLAHFSTDQLLAEIQRRGAQE